MKYHHKKSHNSKRIESTKTISMEDGSKEYLKK